MATSLKRWRRTKQTRKTSVWQVRKSHAVHHPSPVWQPLLRNRLPTLCIIVHTQPIPLLVTPRSPRSVRGQRRLNRVCAHMCQDVWLTMMFWSTRHIPRHLSKQLLIYFLFFSVCFAIKFSN